MVQSNEFASLHKNPSYGETYQQALSIMTYCAKTDPQASRLVYIMTTFHNVIVSRAPASSSLRDPSSIPNTPSGGAAGGGTLVSTPDPMANFFLSHSTPTTAQQQQHAAPTSAPAPASSSSGSAFDPALSMPPHHAHPHHPHHQQPQPPPTGLHRRDSANTNNPATCGPSPSPGMMPTALTPTTSSTGGDPLSMDAEWFHFDTLWENWAATPQPQPQQGGPPPPSSSGGAAAQAQNQGLADPALFGDPASLGGFDVSGSGGGGGGGPGSAFATPPLPGAQQGGSGMNVPLYPMIRFAE